MEKKRPSISPDRGEKGEDYWRRLLRFIWMGDKGYVEDIMLIKEPKHRSLSNGEGDGG